MRSPVCLRVSLVPIYYHTLTVYSLPRETVMQGPLVIGDCYLGIIRIQTTSTGLSPAETTTTLPPRLYFCCMLITAFYTPHTNLTSSSHTTQPVSTGFSEWTSFQSPLCIHASPLYFGGHDYRPHGSLATAATRTSVLLSYTLRPSNRHYFPSKSFSPSSQIQTPSKRRTLLAVFMAIELSYEAAASTNTQRTPCFRCFLQDVRLTSIRE